MVAGILLVTAGAGVVYVMTVLNSTTKTLSATFTDVGNKNTAKTVKATEPLTILLMGVDTGGDGRGDSNSWDGNADSSILMTLNPKTKTTTMVSIERDTLSNILDGDGNIVSTAPTKLNSAYPSGYNNGGFNSAVSYAMKTVGLQAGLDVGNFVTMNFDGLIDLVNDVGGIDVDNTSGTTLFISDTEPQYTATVEQGKQHLNGEQALVYARDRHHRANGDYGRAAAQREVITSVMKKVLAVDNITQYQKFLNDISKDFKTNIPVSASTITSFLGYKDCFDKIVSVQYQGLSYDGTDGASYQITPEATALAVQNVMRKSLAQSVLTSLDPNLVTYENYTNSQASSFFLPSATVTEGKKAETYGVNQDGSLVAINSSNSGLYVGIDGSSLSSSDSASDSSASSQTADASTETTPAAQGGGATSDDTTTYDPATASTTYQ
ncbi:LytR family transcriptional regulator [Lactococcus termiticola]|uniref:LytR family transcriptional regulator n=2 Tax=Lactococcus termiticola TaxID=2169526 RepID=A0A2R5HD67_9LACT|nr:LytR family transcriptional regulator [Lactococcus termiticola]